MEHQNNYESPQSTEHLDLPMAECNHMAHCNECKLIIGINIVGIVLLFIALIGECMIINQVRKYEERNNVQVYERNFKWEHLRGPEVK